MDRLFYNIAYGEVNFAHAISVNHCIMLLAYVYTEFDSQALLVNPNWLYCMGFVVTYRLGFGLRFGDRAWNLMNKSSLDKVSIIIDPCRFLITIDVLTNLVRDSCL